MLETGIETGTFVVLISFSIKILCSPSFLSRVTLSIVALKSGVGVVHGLPCVEPSVFQILQQAVLSAHSENIYCWCTVFHVQNY